MLIELGLHTYTDLSVVDKNVIEMMYKIFSKIVIFSQINPLSANSKLGLIGQLKHQVATKRPLNNRVFHW